MLDVLKHEVVHSLEQTNPKAYKQLREFVMRTVAEKGTGRYFGFIDTKIAAYRKSGVDIDSVTAQDELLAEFVKEIMTNNEAVDYFIGKDRSLAERIFAAIKAAWHKLFQVNYNRPNSFGFDDIDIKQTLEYFEKALNANENVGENDSVEGEKRYAVAYTTKNEPVAIINDDILENVPKFKWVDTVKSVIKEKYPKSIPISGRLIKINAVTRNEFTNSKYSQFLKTSSGKIYKDKFKSANHLDDIILATTNYVNEDLKHERTDNIIEFARGNILMRIGENDYSAKVVVGFTSGRNMVLYDIVDFIPSKLAIKKDDKPIGYAKKAGSLRNDLSSNTTVPQKAQSVNNNISENAENDTEKKFSLKNDDSMKEVSRLQKQNERLKAQMKKTNGVHIPASFSFQQQLLY